MVVLVGLLASCSLVNSDWNSTRLVGKWRWVRSTGGIGGWTITSDSSGYGARILQFTDSNVFYRFRADTLWLAGFYTLSTSDEIRYRVPDSHFSVNQRIRFRGRDTLVLADQCYDCYTSIYVRLP